jgi:predicted ATPase/DNA-binding NarL/FixJ family response regulator
LALEVASQVANDFANGLTNTSLAAISDPERVLPALIRVLGLREESDLSPLDQLKLALQDEQRLLLLDNFEQVALAAPYLVELLIACPKLRILITSRERLQVRGEYEIPVAPLAVPETPILPDLQTLAQIPAVALFLQRAQAIKPDFHLTILNAAAVAEICTFLEGLPLAIELAAARIKLLPPQALLARLTSSLGARFQLLIGGSQDLPERQQTLYRAVEWSYQLLEPSEQRLFRWLAVFSGGFSLDAVEAIAQIDDHTPLPILDQIASLLDKSLVRHLEQPEGEMRLGMLEMIREYALSQLTASGEENVVRRLHANYYLDLAERAHFGLSRGREQKKWLEWFQLEQDNLRAAIHWLVQAKEADLALQLGGALQWFWFMRGYFREGRAWLAQLLGMAQPNVNSEMYARALNAAGWLAQAQGDYAAAYTLGQQSLTLFRALNHPDGIAWSLNTLGYAHVRQGNTSVGVPLLEESLTLFRAANNLYGSAFSLSLLGFFAVGQQDPMRAHTLVMESLTLCRTLGDTQGTIRALLLLGYLSLDQKEISLASTYFGEALSLSAAINHPYVIAYSLEGLADVASVQGHALRAVRLSAVASALRTKSTAAPAALLQAKHAGYLEDTRQKLTTEAYTGAWAEGVALTLTQAMLEATQGLPSPATDQASVVGLPSAHIPNNLTAREVEVLRLVAQGLTDSQVAEQLVLSQRTIHSHLRSIYSKLGITSRSAATRYAFEQKLV